MDDGLVLYPHFQPQVVPGWLDKAWKRRHRATPGAGQRGAAVAAPRVGGSAARRQAARPPRLQDLGRRRGRPHARVAPRLAEAQRLADEFAEWCGAAAGPARAPLPLR
jgi:hypothetical protein